MKGNIVEPAGEIGFGWDVVFVPDGYNQTLGSMSLEQKNKISMRAQAVHQLKEFLRIS